MDNFSLLKARLEAGSVAVTFVELVEGKSESIWKEKLTEKIKEMTQAEIDTINTQCNSPETNDED